MRRLRFDKFPGWQLWGQRETQGYTEYRERANAHAERIFSILDAVSCSPTNVDRAQSVVIHCQDVAVFTPHNVT
jgi:hypothetical protein